MLTGLKRFILWDYPRACWQYDVMVGLILAFIFLTPREFFRDQPRTASIVMLHGDQGRDVYWIEPHMLAEVPESERASAASVLLRKQFGKNFQIVRVEPIFDSESEIRAYMALVKP